MPPAPCPPRGDPTPWSHSADHYREYTRTRWNEKAQDRVRVLRFLEPYGSDLIDSLGPKPGERVSDLATGPEGTREDLRRRKGADGYEIPCEGVIVTARK